MRRLLLSTAIAAVVAACTTTPLHAGFGSTVVDLFKGAFKSADDLAKAAKESAEAAIDSANVGRKLDDAADLGKYGDGPPPAAIDEFGSPPPGWRWSTKTLSPDDPQFGKGLRDLVMVPDVPAGATSVLRNVDEVPPGKLNGYVLNKFKKGADEAPGYQAGNDGVFKTGVLGDAASALNKADEVGVPGYIQLNPKWLNDVPPNAYTKGPLQNAAKADDAATSAAAGGKPGLVSRPTGIDPNDIPTDYRKIIVDANDLPALPSGLFKTASKGLPDAPNPYGQLKFLDEAASAAQAGAKAGAKRVMRPAYPARYYEALAKVPVAAAKKAAGISPKKVIIGGTVTGLVVGGGVTTYVLYNTYAPVTEFVDGAVADTEAFGEKAKEDLETFGDDAEAGISEFGKELGNAADQTADVFKSGAVLTVNNFTGDRVEVFEVVFGTRKSLGVSEKVGDFVSFAGRVGDKIEITRNGEYFTGFTLEQDELIYVQ